MSVTEGARWMRRTGQWMPIAPLASLLILISVALIMSGLHAGLGSPFGLMPFILLWFAGWMADGFVKQAK